MRILTLNCNGVRSAASKGLFDWLSAQKADVICLQETKAQEHQLGDPCFRPLGYACGYFDAWRSGPDEPEGRYSDTTESLPNWNSR